MIYFQVHCASVANTSPDYNLSHSEDILPKPACVILSSIAPAKKVSQLIKSCVCDCWSYSKAFCCL